MLLLFLKLQEHLEEKADAAFDLGVDELLALLTISSRARKQKKTKMVEGRDASKHIIVEQLSSCVHMLYLQYNILTQYSI